MRPYKLDPREHQRHPFRAHDLAPDFRLLDVWRIPVRLSETEGESFEAFHRFLANHGTQTGTFMAQALKRIRELLGKLLGWDRDKHTLAVPGCRETSIRERLTESDESNNRASSVALPKQPLVDLRPVYLFENESLQELNNRTIHALFHLARVPDGRGGSTAQLAVYAKSRGLLSDLYMTLIEPFRLWFVYPQWIRHLTKAWEVHTSSSRDGEDRDR